MDGPEGGSPPEANTLQQTTPVEAKKGLFSKLFNRQNHTGKMPEGSPNISEIVGEKGRENIRKKDLEQMANDVSNKWGTPETKENIVNYNLDPNDAEAYASMVASQKKYEQNQQKSDRSKESDSIPSVEEIKQRLISERPNSLRDVITDDQLEMRAVRMRLDAEIRSRQNLGANIPESNEQSVSDSVNESEQADPPNPQGIVPFTPLMGPQQKNNESITIRKEQYPQLATGDRLKEPVVSIIPLLETVDSYKESFRKEDNSPGEKSMGRRRLEEQYPDRWVGQITDANSYQWNIALWFGDRSDSDRAIRIRNEKGESITTQVKNTVLIRNADGTDSGIQYINTYDGWFGAVMFRDPEDNVIKPGEYKPISSEVGFNLMKLLAPFQDEVDELRSNDVLKDEQQNKNSTSVAKVA